MAKQIRQVRPVSLENVTIGFRNFEGREDQFNKNGDRSFSIFLEDDVAEKLSSEGWNVKFPKESTSVDPDENPRQPHLQVSVGFEYYPANVFLISNGNPTKIGEEEVGMLDWAEIEFVDVILRPYEWAVSGNSGIKAYLKSGYFTIVADKFAEKYGV